MTVADLLLTGSPLPELEPLPGSIVPQFICCGKPGCRCQTGNRHGPYHYRVWREAGRVRKVYVKITDVERVQEQIRLYEKYAAELKRLTRLCEALSTSLALQIAVFHRLMS